MNKAFTAGLIVAAVVGLISFKKYQGNDSQLQVTAEQVTEQTLSDTILASGNLVFNNQIQIRSEVTGIVTDVLVEEGDMVQKDQVLLQLDPTAFKADVASYRAAVNAQQIDIEYATEVVNDLARQLRAKQQLLAKGMVGQDSVDSLESQHRIAEIKVKAAQESLKQKQAALEQATDRLNKTTFKAAMPGLISAVDVKPGETVIAGTTNIVGSSLMTLADPSTILAELRVDEADIANVKIDQGVEVFASSDPRKALAGKVISIGTSARSQGQGRGLFFRVKVLLNQADRLYPGMSCRAEIILAQSAPSLSVPISAVHKQQGEHFVWLVENSKAKKQPVTVGMATDTQQSINTGLKLKDLVITGPSRLVNTLKEGASLKVEKEKL